MVTALGAGPEFDLIRRFLDRRPPADRVPGVVLGPGDDCALVQGDTLALTCDMAVEDVHFRRAWLQPPEIGYHAAAAALSDLAAMAARPLGVLVSIGAAAGDRDLAAGIMEGVAEAVESVGGALLGGDVVRSPGPLLLDVMAVGDAPRPVRRSGAAPGDELWVTGELGGAAAAVAAWLAGEEPSPESRRAFARPTPRVREALWLAERGLPTAMIDLSDGIAGDAGHIAAAGGVRVVIDASSLPVAPAARGAGGIALAAAGGQDFELCFAARPGAMEADRPAFEAELGTRLTRVGRVEEGEGASVVDDDGVALDLRAYQHWGDG